jgi:hypothetical protein
MICRILLIALAIGGAGSSWYYNHTFGEGESLRTIENKSTNMIKAKPLPDLYEADIDTITHGLECKHFTNIDFVKVNHFSTAH